MGSGVYFDFDFSHMKKRGYEQFGDLMRICFVMVPNTMLLFLVFYEIGAPLVHIIVVVILFLLSFLS